MLRSGVILILLLLCSASTAVHGKKKYVDRLPRISQVIDGFDIAKLTKAIDQAPLHHIEGIWRFPATGTEIAILRNNFDNLQSLVDSEYYQIIVTYSANRALRPGTLIGIIVANARQGEYDARIYTKTVGSRQTLPKDFSLTLSEDDSSLRFKRNQSAFSVNLWRLLPYLWRGVVHKNNTSHDDDGCIRIYPAPTYPRQPIYL